MPDIRCPLCNSLHKPGNPFAYYPTAGMFLCYPCYKFLTNHKGGNLAQSAAEEFPVDLSEFTDSYEEKEIEQMARLTSDIEGASVASTIPQGPYSAHVCNVMDTDKNDVTKPLTSRAGAPMVQLDWEIDEGDYAGRKIKFDTIMLGGNSAEGKPIGLGNLCNFLHRTGVPWHCRDCGSEADETARRFYIADGTEDDKSKGLKKGNFYCPDCKSAVPRIGYDTANFNGARCKIGVGTKTNEGREFNIVKGYADIS